MSRCVWLEGMGWLKVWVSRSRGRRWRGRSGSWESRFRGGAKTRRMSRRRRRMGLKCVRGEKVIVGEGGGGLQDDSLPCLIRSLSGDLKEGRDVNIPSVMLIVGPRRCTSTAVKADNGCSGHGQNPPPFFLLLFPLLSPHTPALP